MREKKIGTVIVFVVDSSGSMGAQKRMIETKGAVLSLLVDSYQKRDRVGLVAFKGNRAEVLLEPSSSVEIAKKRLEELPTGGKTPLSGGLVRAFDIIMRERSKNKKILPLLVLISDGRANVSMDGSSDPFDEALSIATRIHEAAIQSVIIDTEKGLVRLGRLERLAGAMGATHHRLADLRADAITGIVGRARDRS